MWQNHAGLTPASVRGQLAGLTARLRNPKYGFSQKAWPIRVERLPAGNISYTMDPELGALWRALRAELGSIGDGDHVPTDGSNGT